MKNSRIASILSSITASASLALVSSALLSSPARAATFGFDCITNNDVTGTNCASGESQLSVMVSAGVGGDALFTFINVGASAASITDIYFDDLDPGTTKVLLSMDTITNGTGVNFSQGAKPEDLPGGTAINFSADSDAYTADSNSPKVQQSGINPGETLSISFNLAAGKTVDDVINDLNSGDLRIGIHVQGFENGGSEGLVTTSSRSVPEPGMVAALGLFAVGTLGLRKQKGQRNLDSPSLKSI